LQLTTLIDKRALKGRGDPAALIRAIFSGNLMCELIILCVIHGMNFVLKSFHFILEQYREAFSAIFILYDVCWQFIVSVCLEI
jgi:hypothetical protein